MKIRNSFVANSSSTSFYIATNGEITKENFLEAFKVPEESPLYGIGKKIAEVLTDVKRITFDEFLEKNGYENESELPEQLKKILQMKIYSGLASDEGGGMEGVLCWMDIEYITDDLIIIKDGGY